MAYSTKVFESSFSELEKRAVWNKGTIVTGCDSNKVRKDLCGAWIHYDKYGDTTENGYGWEIDHIKPVSKGGTDNIANLQPLHWQNNRAKGDDYPAASGYCVISATEN
jgi:5-methylcytosine-specific restriction endonuclease McrA